MNAPANVRTERVRAFVAWLNTVEHPHWEQPGFADFADLTQTERLEAARVLKLQAAAHDAHADKLHAELRRRIDARTGGAPPERKSPKDAGTSKGPNAKAVRAIASLDAYTRSNRDINKPSMPAALEGEFRHARYRLRTRGRLSVQDDNSEGRATSVLPFPNRPLKAKPGTEPYFGLCPQCGGQDRGFNIGAEHYFTCDEHRTAWWCGSNLFSGWRDEPESLHDANRKMLGTLRLVEPWYPKEAHND